MKAVLAYQGRATYLVRGSNRNIKAFYPFDERTIIYDSLKNAQRHKAEIGADEAVAQPLKNVVVKAVSDDQV